MGIKERRQREIEALKIAIVKAARDIALQEGWPKVSIRKITKIIEYTSPVIYEHFKNKEAILAEIESFGFRDLKNRLEQEHSKHKEADKQLINVSLAYWDFAFDNPELYQVMFNLEGTQSQSPNPEAIRTAADCIVSSLKHLHTFPAERESLFINWWSMVHGYISIIMAGHLPGFKNKMKAELQGALERFIKSMV